jgi:hypothetical protein
MTVIAAWYSVSGWLVRFMLQTNRERLLYLPKPCSGLIYIDHTKCGR